MEDLNDKNEVMTLAEVADFLQLAEKTVLRMAHKGQIPAAKVASQWRFLRSIIKDWLASQMQIVSSPKIPYLAANNRDISQLNGIIRPDLIRTVIQPGSKDTILKQLITPLRETGFAQQPELFLQKTMEREKMMTTAIGHGVAMPHPRKPIENMFPEPAIVVGICPKGTNFDAIDDQLVHLFFLICATREEIHLQLMAKIGWLIRNKKILAKLKQATSKEQVMELIKHSMKESNPNPVTN
jgi:excisionase family DNA binding protein